MKRKSRIITILVAIGLSAGAAFTYGVAVGKFALFPYKTLNYYYDGYIKNLLFPNREHNFKGRWRQARESRGDNNRSEMDDIASLPYLQGHKPAPNESGVTVYKKGAVFEGLNFFFSGHKPAAFLMDMDGNIVHMWSVEMDSIWPGMLPFKEAETHKFFWRKAHLYDNGDLLAIYEGIGIIKIDKDSKVIWANQCRAHHDIFVHKNGDIYTLTRKLITEHKRFKPPHPMLEDYVTVLNSDGEILKSVSILDCFLNSNYANYLFGLPRIKTDDIFHTNTIEIIDRTRNRVFRQGLALVSFRNNHTIALIDLNRKKVAWAMTGMWLLQHQPELLPGGNILLFDNIGNGRKSKVIEFNPLTQEIVWSYQGTPEKRLYSTSCGSNTRLPNGNTLITESDYGRAIEVTPDKEVVWEYVNPFRAGENDELIATLFEMVRIPTDMIDCAGKRKGRCFE